MRKANIYYNGGGYFNNANAYPNLLNSNDPCLIDILPDLKKSNSARKLLFKIILQKLGIT